MTLNKDKINLTFSIKLTRQREVKMNESWNETDLDNLPARLAVSPCTLVEKDYEFYLVVAAIIIASASVPNLFIIVQILR